MVGNIEIQNCFRVIFVFKLYSINPVIDNEKEIIEILIFLFLRENIFLIRLMNFNLVFINYMNAIKNK